MNGRKTLLLRELVHRGKLGDYEIELHDIIECIRSNGCEISTIDNDKRSRLESSKTPPYKNRIRLSLAEDRMHRLHLIWDLLHEFGHYLSGSKQDDSTVLEREELAWKYAEIELNKYPRLAVEVENFNNRKIFCLQTYRNLGFK